MAHKALFPRAIAVGTAIAGRPPHRSGPNYGIRLLPWVSDGEAGVAALSMRSCACDTLVQSCVRRVLCGPAFPSVPAPPAPRPVAQLRSSASQRLWRSVTSPVRSSPATAPRLPDAIRRGERPGSLSSRARSLGTCQGLRAGPSSRWSATVRIAFRSRNIVCARDNMSFAAHWLAYASPCRRFAADLAIDCARLGAGAVREPSP